MSTTHKPSSVSFIFRPLVQSWVFGNPKRIFRGTAPGLSVCREKWWTASGPVTWLESGTRGLVRNLWSCADTRMSFPRLSWEQ